MSYKVITKDPQIAPKQLKNINLCNSQGTACSSLGKLQWEKSNCLRKKETDLRKHSRVRELGSKKGKTQRTQPKKKKMMAFHVTSFPCGTLTLFCYF